MKKLIAITFILSLSACTGYPDNIKPVSGFELSRYLGTWYEIARLDHSFERDMDQVTAHYSRRDDGGVRVINKGFNSKKQAWKEAEGKAYFVGSEDSGHLKVSFFGPFYGSYVVFSLDGDYHQAYVAGNDYGYLWFLSRTPVVSAADKQRFIELVRERGFDAAALIWVKH